MTGEPPRPRPSPDAVRRGWAERRTEFSPGYYAHRGADVASEGVRRVLDDLVEPDVPVLEVGCSSGRHLAHLRDAGYAHLNGVDVNGDAFDVMAAEYPRLAEAGTFYHDTIERAVGGFATGEFGAVFSVETLQHLHADASWVFAELARVTDDVLVTVECESPVGGDGGGTSGVNYVDEDLPLYYRRWDRVFTDLGLVEVGTRTLPRTTLRAFRHR